MKTVFADITSMKTLYIISMCLQILPPCKQCPLTCTLSHVLNARLCVIISPKFENFGDIMFLVAPPPSPPSQPPPPPHAKACTGHIFVTNTPIKFIFAIAIEVPEYKNPIIFVINRKNKMASGGHFV